MKMRPVAELMALLGLLEVLTRWWFTNVTLAWWWRSSRIEVLGLVKGNEEEMSSGQLKPLLFEVEGSTNSG